MSDNLRRYRAIRRALTQCYPSEMSGRLAQHVTTLAALISGIVGSKSSQLPSIATKIADRAKPATILAALLIGTLPFAALTYWSVASPVLAVVALILAFPAIKRAHKRDPAQNA